MRLPKVFVGSSSEAYPLARAFCAELKDIAEMVPWRTAPEWRTMWSTLDGVLQASDAYDFGLFIFFPDDDSVSRGERRKAVRDNVLLELGVFLGTLGRDRTLVFVAETHGSRSDQRLRILSDLEGSYLPRARIPEATYERVGSGNVLRLRYSPALRRAVQGVAKQMAAQIGKVGRIGHRLDLLETWGFRNGVFSGTVPKDRLIRHGSYLSRGRLLLVCAIGDGSGPISTQRIAGRSVPKVVPRLFTDNLTFAAKIGSAKPGEKILGCLLFLPNGVSTPRSQTIEDLVDSGCDIVGRGGWTVQGPRRAAIQR